MLLFALLLGLVSGDAPPQEVTWKQLAPGMELAYVEAKQPGHEGDGPIAVVRIDPNDWALEIAGRSEGGEAAGRTAREWARKSDLGVAINAGMFDEDYTTHIGYLESDGQVRSPRINSYQSVAAFDPHDRTKQPSFRIFDLDVPGVTIDSIRGQYGSVVQNLRLIKRPGLNRWSPQDRSWSEAALGEDESGRILFVFARARYSMHDLVRELLAARIGIVAAQHLEGGRLAQLYLNVGDVELELFEGSGTATAWPIPNVIGVRRRRPAE